MTVTQIAIDDSVRPVYCGDKYVYNRQVYVVAVTPCGTFLLINVGDGSYWGDGAMDYDALVREIDFMNMPLVGLCQMKVHICPS